MKLKILGCSGGVGVGLRTTSMLVDNDILIDAGSGVGDLSLDDMKHIRHIFLTHSHMDHFAFLPLLVDSIFDSIDQPIVIHSQAETIHALQTHIFNWTIWPNFAELPNKQNPVMRFEPMTAGECITVGDRTIEALKVRHIVPGIGYRVSSKEGSFAFSGDTTTQDDFWKQLNQRKTLDILIVEAAFANDELELSRKAGHYTPMTLAEDMDKLKLDPKIYISHTKPGQEDLIVDQCKIAMPDRQISRLRGGDEFNF